MSVITDAELAVPAAKVAVGQQSPISSTCKDLVDVECGSMPASTTVVAKEGESV